MELANLIPFLPGFCSVVVSMPAWKAEGTGSILSASCWEILRMNDHMRRNMTVDCCYGSIYIQVIGTRIKKESFLEICKDFGTELGDKFDID